jgi:hypothetical protein
MRGAEQLGPKVVHSLLLGSVVVGYDGGTKQRGQHRGMQAYDAPCPEQATLLLPKVARLLLCTTDLMGTCPVGILMYSRANMALSESMPLIRLMSVTCQGARQG